MNIDKIIDKFSSVDIKKVLLKCFFFLYRKKNFVMLAIALGLCIYELVTAIQDWSVYKQYTDATIKNNEGEARADRTARKLFKNYEKEWQNRLKKRHSRSLFISITASMFAFLYIFSLPVFYVFQWQKLKNFERKFKELLC